MMLILERHFVCEDVQKKIVLSSIKVRRIFYFVAKSTVKFFETLTLFTDFLKKYPSTWHFDKSDCRSERVTSKICVTNDAAERELVLMHEYNSARTKSEKQIRFILQVVSEDYKTLPSITKISLLTKK